MKHIKKYCLLFILIVSFSKAQVVFCPPGATWHYQVYEPPFLGFVNYDGILKYTYAGDTTINNILCKKLVGDFTGKYYTFMGNISNLPGLRRHYTFINNGVLYAFNGNGFDTVVNFNANIGDSWRRMDYYLCIPTGKKLTVTDTSHVNINNHWLKKIKAITIETYTLYNNGGINTATVQLEFVERLLNINSTLGSQMFSSFCDYEEVVDWSLPLTTFRCYSDNSFPLYKNGLLQCDETTAINETMAAKNNLSISPNPANDIVTIQFKDSNAKNYTVQLSDVAGRIIEETRLEDETAISVSKLVPGIYFVNLISGNQVIASRKLFVEH